ncbi:MAG: SDR family oxidoreductase [Pseudomonadota bacterium]
MKVMITGAAGYVGSQLVAQLAESDNCEVHALDIRGLERLPETVTRQRLDVRDRARVFEAMSSCRPDVVVHLAAIVTPGPESSRELEYQVDVEGTRHVLDACIESGVRRLVVASSGAAYGYHPDHPSFIRESQATRGNEEFAYSWHKHLVERMLAKARSAHPELQQVVLRVGTVLGENTQNQLSAMFLRPFLLSVKGGDDRFVFIWDQDLIRCLCHAVHSQKAGVFNVCGDGALSTREMARLSERRFVSVSGHLLGFGLRLAGLLRLTQLKPEQVRFLKYRPVLSNDALKNDFGFTPEKTTKETFLFFHEANRD